MLTWTDVEALQASAPDGLIVFEGPDLVDFWKLSRAWCGDAGDPPSSIARIVGERQHNGRWAYRLEYRDVQICGT